MKRGVCIWIAALAAMVAGTARAGDDGGGRSVFAIGAGNRALGLGGAYAAVADDASAPLWNPAGLGLVTRSAFQATQTSYFDLGVDEQYASLVLPSWRYGVASITLRHFGVEGIERRDERNVLLDENLTDSETELSFGYGRRMGDWWGLGTVVKLRRQSLGGFSGSGVGLDVGVIGNPLVALYPNDPSARRLSVGVSVRNALEPQLKLMDESVPDPTGLRFGTAYLIPIGGNRNVLAAFDVEKTFETNPRFHGGLEFAVHPMLTVRAGTTDGVFTAGSGVAWNAFTLDYSFENTTLGGVHRVGIDFAFGATVDDRRYAYDQAREDELQSRLQEVFERRRRERVGELSTQADAAMNEGRFEEALSTLGVIEALAPGAAGTGPRRAQCLLEIAHAQETAGDYASASIGYSQVLEIAPDHSGARDGLERCRAESARIAERTLEIRRLFEAALDAFSRSELDEAERGFASILEQAPDDDEARMMLQRTREALALRVSDLLDEASRLIDWGHLDEARARIADARAIEPDARRIDTVEASLRKAVRARTGAARPTDTQTTATTPTGTSAAQVSDADRRELERLYKSGVDAMKEERSQDAIRYFELVWSVDPLYQRVTEHLKREYLVRGMEFFASGQLDRAVEYWENARRVDPTDQRVIGYLARAREQVARTRQILGADE